MYDKEFVSGFYKQIICPIKTYAFGCLVVGHYREIRGVVVKIIQSSQFLTWKKKKKKNSTSMEAPGTMSHVLCLWDKVHPNVFTKLTSSLHTLSYVQSLVPLSPYKIYRVQTLKVWEWEGYPCPPINKIEIWNLSELSNPSKATWLVTFTSRCF